MSRREGIKARKLYETTKGGREGQLLRGTKTKQSSETHVFYYQGHGQIINDPQEVPYRVPDHKRLKE